MTGAHLASYITGSKAALGVGVALLCAGCAVLQPGAEGDAGAFDRAAATTRNYRPAVTLEGRMSLRYGANGREQSVHGSFVWAQTAQRTDLQLLSPLGQTLATIAIEPGLATLVEAGKPPRSAPDADQLTEQTLGWPLPVSGLGDWLQGFARTSDGRRFVAQPQPGDLEDATAANSVTTADQWRIKYVNWQTTTAGLMPKRIDLGRSTGEAGEVAIRIVVDKVQLP